LTKKSRYFQDLNEW